MTKEEKKIAIAEIRGWKWSDEFVLSPTGSRWARFHPTSPEREATNLPTIKQGRLTLSATAEKRCDAILKVFGKLKPPA
jgi:hypothetical protein